MMPPFGHRQRHALQHQDHVVVDHLDVVDLEQGARGLRRGAASLERRTCERRCPSWRAPRPRGSASRGVSRVRVSSLGQSRGSMLLLRGSAAASSRPAAADQSSSAAIPVGCEHPLASPSHCWIARRRARRVVRAGDLHRRIEAVMPSSSSRASSRFSASMPSRICSPRESALAVALLRRARRLGRQHRRDHAAVVQHRADRSSRRRRPCPRRSRASSGRREPEVHARRR